MQQKSCDVIKNKMDNRKRNNTYYCISENVNLWDQWGYEVSCHLATPGIYIDTRTNNIIYYNMHDRCMNEIFKFSIHVPCTVSVTIQ